ncbi:ABC transporter ATP-binding protein [soil metagenome]
MLELRNVSKVVGAETHIDAVSLTLDRGSFNVLLGPTLSGKTSLMRLMAGLDRPTTGQVWFEGKDVTGMAVQKRNVAMVYQQFINYPSMTVFENIASPLRVKGVDGTTIKAEVGKAAELLRLTPYLDRTPLSLSGGQQQRTAIARAVVKKAEVVLLDEPLANLDYKLREELRAELPKVFAESGAIVVYATTEPMEALLLGGHTATLSQGRITQFGPTIEVYRRPADLTTARTFADPPLNTAQARKAGSHFLIGEGAGIAAPPGLVDGDYVIGVRAHHLTMAASPGASRLAATVYATEITGSESYIHIDVAGSRWVMLAHGVHPFEAGQALEVFVEPRRLMVFDGAGVALQMGEAA